MHKSTPPSQHADTSSNYINTKMVAHTPWPVWVQVHRIQLNQAFSPAMTIILANVTSVEK